jgi:hypothetical protein
VGVLCRFLRFLAAQRPAPGDLARLRAAHLDLFRAHRAATVAPAGTLREMRQLLALLGQEPLRGSLPGEVTDYLGRRWQDPRQAGRPGYSDGELAKILAAARSDVVAACRRIEAAERLLHRYQHDRAAPSEAELAAGAELAAMDATGLVPGGRRPSLQRRRKESAPARCEPGRRHSRRPARRVYRDGRGQRRQSRPRDASCFGTPVLNGWAAGKLGE